MQVVFCTTCKGRAQHIKQTLPKNLADNPEAVIVLLDYGSPDDLIPYVHQNHRKELESGQLKLYSFFNLGPFKMAHAKNMAHRLGLLHGDILVNMDADNFAAPGFDRWVREQFERDPHVFLWARMVKGELARGISGRIAVTAKAFLKLGGYDERYREWGPDDKDFNCRLQLLGYTPVEIPQPFLNAIHHGPKLRFRDYRHIEAQADSGEIPIEICPHSAVVNFGVFGCGPVMQADKCFHLWPLPTRIFGIGWHKTGTTSLAYALKLLGYESAHWENPRHAKRIYTQMQDFAKSLTLEHHYALSDFPIAILYKELDKAYPRSKFILTIRDERSWLRSVERHWGPDNPHRATWNHDHFTHRMHNLAYGRKSFDSETFLARYRHHNDQVLEYFKDRPEDLLVLRLGEGWEKLCEYLGKAVPDVPYPELNFSNGINQNGI